ncbi:Homeobox B7, partial [Cichlidogyrus casuarinus]
NRRMKWKKEHNIAKLNGPGTLEQLEMMEQAAAAANMLSGSCLAKQVDFNRSFQSEEEDDASEPSHEARSRHARSMSRLPNWSTPLKHPTPVDGLHQQSLHPFGANSWTSNA